MAFEAAMEATPEQRLAWLEQAIELAQLAGVLPRSGPDRGPEIKGSRER